MFDPWLFTTDEKQARLAQNSGISGIIIDWECLDKKARQVGAGFECNHDTIEDLARIRLAVDISVICRINGFGSWTADEVEAAIRNGADILMLPMVENADQVKDYLKIISGRAKAGILIETQEALENLKDIASLNIDFVYAGLNDLMLSRNTESLFESIIDGTIDKIRNAFMNCYFGFGGVTLIGQGFPLPFNLLFSEMARLNCDFGFLRRSFKKDIKGKDWTNEIPKIRQYFIQLKNRSPEEITKNREALLNTVKDIRRKALV